MTSGNAVISSIAVQEAEEGETEEEQLLAQLSAGTTVTLSRNRD